MSSLGKHTLVDLTADAVPNEEETLLKRLNFIQQQVEHSHPHPHPPTITATVPSVSTILSPLVTKIISVTPSAATRPPKASKVLNKNKPHVLIWVCHNGPGQRHNWTKKNLKIVGVYASKEEAEAKKQLVISQNDFGGYADMSIGGTWEDEIDLVVRPAEECTL